MKLYRKELRLEPKIDFETSSFLLQSQKRLPKVWICLWVGIKPKDTTKPKSRRRKDLFLAASKENTEDISQNSTSLNSKIGKVLS